MKKRSGQENGNLPEPMGRSTRRFGPWTLLPWRATVGAYAVVMHRRRRPKLSLALLTDVTSEDAPLRMP